MANRARLSAFAAAALAVMVVSAAAAADMASIVQTRQTHFKEIGKASKAMSEQLKSAAPALPVIQQSAQQIDALAPQVSSWFPVGSGPEAGVKTQAKAEIWARPDEFKRDAIAFTDAAHKFHLIAGAGDMTAIRAQAQVMGQTCKTCHQAFRQRDD